MRFTGRRIAGSSKLFACYYAALLPLKRVVHTMAPSLVRRSGRRSTSHDRLIHRSSRNCCLQELALRMEAIRAAIHKLMRFCGDSARSRPNTRLLRAAAC